MRRNYSMINQLQVRRSSDGTENNRTPEFLALARTEELRESYFIFWGEQQPPPFYKAFLHFPDRKI